MLPNYAQFRNALEICRSSNGSKSNEVSRKCFLRKVYSQYLKNCVPGSHKKHPLWCSYQKKKRFSPQIFVKHFHKNIHNLAIKMFYQIADIFSLLLSNLCVGKISCQYHEIYVIWSSPELTTFLQKLSN